MTTRTTDGAHTMDTRQAPAAGTVRGVRVRDQLLGSLAVAAFTAAASAAVAVVLALGSGR